MDSMDASPKYEVATKHFTASHHDLTKWSLPRIPAVQDPYLKQTNDYEYIHAGLRTPRFDRFHVLTSVAMRPLASECSISKPSASWFSWTTANSRWKTTG